MAPPLSGGCLLPGFLGPSQPLSLAIGNNLIELLVAAQNGAATKIYSIAVTRSATKTGLTKRDTAHIPIQSTQRVANTVTSALSPRISRTSQGLARMSR